MGKTRQSANLVSDNNIFVDIVNDRVGIGTTNPQFDLDVSGDINFEGSFYQNGDLFVASRWDSGTGDDIYRLDGNIGIGTTNPTTKLDVSGEITATGGFNLGISSAGTSITSGPITELNFVGAGNTFAVEGTTVDISIAGGGEELDITSSLFV
jgi:hypothetical protein